MEDGILFDLKKRGDKVFTLSPEKQGV